ncbi:MAG: putative bifunctional diguanylate cyclase/phosphodiesterase [Wujia sp.]
MEQVNQKILNIMMHTLNNSFFYWDVVNNSIDVSALYIEKDLHLNNTDPITRIIQNKAIPKEDVDALERTRDKIINGALSPIDDATISVKFRILDALHKSERSAPWYKIIFYLNKNDRGLIYEAAAVLREMTENEIMNKEILESFSNDRNPRIFNSRITRLIEAHPDEEFAFVQFDIKNFKFLNENYGEEFGNDILNNILNVLKFYSSNTFIYSRLTADVFMFVTTYKNRDNIIRFINELEPQINHYKDVSFRICFGVNFAEDLTKQPRYNGDCAAIARFACKRDAVSRYVIYEDSLRSNQRHKKDLEDNLRIAIGNHEFVMFLQPKYDIETRKVHGAEALVRWVRPDGITVPPNDFIPLAEENGFVKEIDHFIWEEACKTIRKWIDQGKEPIPISVNVSRAHLDNHDFITILNSYIARYNIPKNLLEIEITETIQNDNTDASIMALKKDGFTLLMDDFGSGYSSLKMINETPFDVLKIDRSFLNSFLDSDRGKKIIAHTINMSQDIGLDMIAEGVETTSQEEFLLANGCRYAQGYLFSRPIPLKDFEQKYMA